VTTSERDPSTYTIRGIQEMLGLSRGVVAGLIAAGFVTPSRGRRNEYRFTFRDVVVLRTAVDLQAAKIPPRRILAALRKLRATLPAELPLSGLRISAVGNDVTVREGRSQWHAESGQMVMDFEVQPSSGNVSFLQRAPARAAPPPPDAEAWFRRAEALEASDRRAAESAYRRVLEIDPAHAEAYLNLGALLCESGRPDEALGLYDEALRAKPHEPLLHYNRAIALEDTGNAAAALASYHAALRLAPDLADAHYNAARLHQQLGDAKQALRHFNAYRRLQRQR
jgi:tetratricopeptide (TPR) repeat protein